jgi:hypothetical protein
MPGNGRDGDMATAYAPFIAKFKKTPFKPMTTRPLATAGRGKNSTRRTAVPPLGPVQPA